jgi:hypothetical protein
VKRVDQRADAEVIVTFEKSADDRTHAAFPFVQFKIKAATQ